VTAVRGAALAVAFLLELAAVAAVAAGGWHLGGGTGSRLLLAAGAGLVWTALWGAFCSPRAAVPLPAPAAAALRFLLFAAAAGALAATGRPLAAAVLAGAVVVDSVVLAVSAPGRSGGPAPR
jgi:hypothetical protein